MMMPNRKFYILDLRSLGSEDAAPFASLSLSSHTLHRIHDHNVYA
jgi:hypothetical protein